MGSSPSRKRPILVATSVVLIISLIVVMTAIDGWLADSPTLPTPEGSISEDLIQTHRSYELYRQWTYQETQRTYEWHARSTKILFWLSVFFSASGISFSYWQFVAASKEAKRALRVNELELKSQLVSLAFRSRSIAALVLFVSLAYLLVYAVFIYPVKYPTPPGVAASAGTYPPTSVTERPTVRIFASAPEIGSLDQQTIQNASNQPPE